jgi:uncharacterized protein
LRYEDRNRISRSLRECTDRHPCARGKHRDRALEHGGPVVLLTFQIEVRERVDLMGNPVVNFEIASENAKNLKSFYSKAFGWKFGKGPHKGVHITKTGAKKGIQGFLLERGEFIPDYVSLYIDVEDITKSVAKIEKAGGKVVRPTFSPDGWNKLCIITDPEGHVFTLSELSKRKKASKAKILANKPRG